MHDVDFVQKLGSFAAVLCLFLIRALKFKVGLGFFRFTSLKFILIGAKNHKETIITNF